MRVILIGCVQFSETAFLSLIDNKKVKVVGVITKAVSPFNSDHVNLSLLSEKFRIPCLLADNATNTDQISFVSKCAPDVIFCFGWSHLLSKELLSIPKFGVIGSHPAELPRNRGRHPLIWAIALGLKKTASSFFLMDESADSGPIVSQVPLSIEENDNASTLYSKLSKTALKQIDEIVEKLGQGILRTTIQDSTKANTWRKRNKMDGQVDWRMASSTVHNLVRALSAPYPGAHGVFRDVEYKIWKTTLPVEIKDESNLEPGLVLEVKDNTFRVKCGIGSIWITEHELQQEIKRGSYL